MSVNDIIIAFFIAVGFVSWPIVGKYSQADGVWIGTIVFLTTAVTIVLLSSKDLNTLPTAKALSILIIAGAINGAACYFYAQKVAASEVPTAILVTVVSISMVIASPIIDWALNGASFSVSQIAGFGTAVLTVYLCSH